MLDNWDYSEFTKFLHLLNFLSKFAELVSFEQVKIPGIQSWASLYLAKVYSA